MLALSEPSINLLTVIFVAIIALYVPEVFHSGRLALAAKTDGLGGTFSSEEMTRLSPPSACPQVDNVFTLVNGNIAAGQAVVVHSILFSSIKPAAPRP